MKSPSYLSVQVVPSDPEQSSLLFEHVTKTEQTRRHPFKIARRIVGGSVLCELPTDDVAFPLDERLSILKDRADGVGFLRELDESERVFAPDVGLELTSDDVDGLVDAR